jgi:hypothetical protein
MPMQRAEAVRQHAAPLRLLRLRGRCSSRVYMASGHVVGRWPVQPILERATLDELRDQILATFPLAGIEDRNDVRVVE